jgi:hypothetical protein
LIAAAVLVVFQGIACFQVTTKHEQAAEEHEEMTDLIQHFKMTLGCKQIEDVHTCLERAGERLAIQEKYDAEGTKNHTSGSFKLGIILTSQCSGSGWLVSSLDTRPDLIWQNEMLIDYSSNETKWQTVSWEKYRTDLEQALSSADDHDDVVEMIGFKLMYDQIPQHLYAKFANWLYEKQVHVIHLRQRCAAIAFASQIVKAQRLQLVKGG